MVICDTDCGCMTGRQYYPRDHSAYTASNASCCDTACRTGEWDLLGDGRTVNRLVRYGYDCLADLGYGGDIDDDGPAPCVCRRS